MVKDKEGRRKKMTKQRKSVKHSDVVVTVSKSEVRKTEKE